MATLEQPALAAPRRGPTLEGVLASVWGRLLVPSFFDVFVTALIVILVVKGAGWSHLLNDGDTGWHIRTGDYILANGHVPQTDIFSFSKYGQPWFAWEWLSDVLFSALHSAIGLKGIVLYGCLVLAASMAVLLRAMLWQGVNGMIALALAWMATGAASIHFLARPHLVTILFLGISSWILAADRRQHSKLIWLLLPLTVLWANLHGGFLALIALLGLFAAGTAVESWLDRSLGWSAPIRYAGLAAGCLGVSLINPYGFRQHVHMADYLRSEWIMNHVGEFQSPRFREEAVLHFEVILFLALMIIVPLLRKRRIAEALSIVYFAYAALSAARHIPLFVILAAPQVGLVLTELWNHWTAEAPRASIRKILAGFADDLGRGVRRTTVWLLALPVFLVLSNAAFLKWPVDFPAEIFPVDIVNGHAARIASARILTSDQWADYLIYRNYPKQRVFYDGRSDFYGLALGEDYLAEMYAAWNCRELMQKYGIDLVLAPSEWALANVLKHAGWQVLDDKGKRGILLAPPDAEKAPSGLMKTTSAAEGTKREPPHD